MPFKYDMEKFCPLACGMKEQCDPTIYTVLIAKSKTPKQSLSEFAVYTAKHITALDTYRPPYYHRNMSTEMLGMIYGEYHGSVRDVQAGCLSCENSYMPHGDAYKAWKRATTAELKPEISGEGALSKLPDAKYPNIFDLLIHFLQVSCSISTTTSVLPNLRSSETLV